MILRLELPRLSAAMDHGTVVRWHRQAGDSLAYGDSLCEIAVTNVNRLQRQLSGRQAIGIEKPTKSRVRTLSGVLVLYELTSMETGIIGQIMAKEGDAVGQGDVLALIDTGDHHGTGTAPNPARVVVNPIRNEGISRE